jgi:hypothetical protein
MSNVISLESHRPDPEPAGFAQASKAWLEDWLTDRRLNQSEKEICVWIYLRFNTDHFKETGGELLAWPSWEYLMQKTGLKRSCVAKSLRRLKELGALEIRRGPYNHKETRRGHNQYIARRSKVHVGGPSGEELGPRSGELGPRRGPSKVHPGITIRGDRRGESRSKKEQDSDFGNPRGPTAPEKESKQSSTDSSKPSLRSTCEVPAADGPARPLRLIAPGSTDMDLVKQYEVGRKRFLRRPDGSCFLTETEYEAVCGAKP